MRRLHRTVLGLVAAAVLLGQGLTGPSATAQTTHQGQVRIEPVSRADGRNASQLVAQLWTYFYEKHASDPVPECFSLGATGRVFVGDDQAVCTIHKSQPVMVFSSNTCDTKSGPPFYAVTQRAQRRCARDWDNANLKSVTVRVDGRPAITLSTPCFERLSQQFSFVSPEDNGFGYEPGPGTASAHSYMALMYLPVGRHTYTVTVRFAPSGHYSSTKTLDVVG